MNYHCKNNRHFATLAAQASQQVLGSVYESFKSYRELLKLWQRGELQDKPKLPDYRKKGGLAMVSYPKQAIKLVDGMVRLPLGQQVKAWFGLAEFFVPIPSNLRFEDIKEVRILPRNACFYAEFVYRVKPVKAVVDPLRVMGVDHGINN